MSDSEASSPREEEEAQPADGRPDWRREIRWPLLLAKLAVIAVFVVLLLAVAKALSPVLIPLLVSLLIAYVLNPVIGFLERYRVPRIAGIALVVTATLGLLTGFLLLVVPVVVEEVGKAIEELPGWFDERIAWARTYASERFGLSTGELDAVLDDLASEARGQLLSMFGDLTDSLSRVVNIVLIPVFTVYFLYDFEKIVRYPLRLVPPRYRESFTSRIVSMHEVFGAWLSGQVKVALILAVIFAIVLGAMGLRMGVIIGIVAGLLNVVPYFGALVGGGLAVLMSLMDGDSLLRVLLVLGVFVGIQAFESYWLTPRIVGRSVGLGPVSVLVAILIGGQVAGFGGILIAVPVMAAGSVLVRDLLSLYYESRFFRGATADAPTPVSANVEVDVTVETKGDTAADAEVDTAAETTVDTAADAEVDAATDAEVDAEADADATARVESRAGTKSGQEPGDEGGDAT